MCQPKKIIGPLLRKENNNAIKNTLYYRITLISDSYMYMAP